MYTQAKQAKKEIKNVEHIGEFLREWGYFALFLGSMIEGESVVISASISAYFGYMYLPKVMIIVFTGTFLAEQALYQVGRHYGPGIIDRHPTFHAPAKKAFKLLHRWETVFILSCRFIYGIRIISPVVIGASGIPPRRYIPLNFLAAVVWTLISCIGGYFLGGIIQEISLEIIKRYFFLFTFLIIGVIVLIIYIVRWRRKKSEEMEDE